MQSKYETTDTPETITQAQLSIGSDLMENMSMATRICRGYMQDLHRRVALGETIEPGTLTFQTTRMCVCHTYC